MIEDYVRNFDNGVLEIDFSQYLGSTCPFNKSLKTELEKYEFERLIIRTKYFVKQYSPEFNLLSVEPFFVDVSLYNPFNKYRVLETYSSNNIKVRVLEVEDAIESFYEVSVAEYSLNFKLLRHLYEKVKIYEEKGKVDDVYINRWYKNLGILEYLMNDDKVLEININPPGFKTPIRIIHDTYGECVTNIYPSQSFLDYFQTRLKMDSGRPLNKVSPELDSEIEVGNVKGRVAVVADPFSIFGTGFSIRKHRENPWTLELFMKNKTITSFFAGFMGVITANGRSYLLAGPRGSGKTSLMVANLLQIPTNDRMITIEDTQEIPIKAFKKLGYDLLSLKVRSALMDEGMEIDFEKGLRTTLRLGDSCLILGEIRGKEAKVLYEAMRVGAMSNVVTGTIHADTAYGVYDRVVNDLGVTKGSFKVTDIIVLVNLIKDISGTRKVRRVMEVVEVLKDWEEEPQFQSLFRYNSKTDNLEPTQALLQGKSLVLKELIKNSQAYADVYDILKDIEIRARIKEITVKNINKDYQYEAEYVKPMDTMFLKLYQKLDHFKDEDKIQKLYKEYEQKIQKYLKKQK